MGTVGRNRRLRVRRRTAPTPVVITPKDGTEHLWEKKIRKELMAQMLQEHLAINKKELGIDEAEKQAYRFMDESGNTWEEYV